MGPICMWDKAFESQKITILANTHKLLRLKCSYKNFYSALC